MGYVKRDIESLLEKMLRTRPALALTGPRQSGKSTMLRHLLKNYNYITLDDPFQRELATNDPELFLNNLGDKLVIDEIQLAPELLSYVKMRIDKQRSVKGRYVLTGSQQFHLIKNLSETLAGRIATLELLPFSFAECARAKNLASRNKKKTQPNDLESFVRAALRGSYPELVTDHHIDSYAWYAAYIQTYLERDVRTLYNVGDLRDFQRCLRLLAAQVGQQLNMAAIARDIGISVPTVKKWISILEASGIIFLLPPYYRNLGKRITKAPKLYFIDIGLACHLVGLRDELHLLNGPMAGHLFENYCVIEVYKVFASQGIKPMLYYLRTNNQLEVDLIIETDQLTPVEFKLAKTPSRNMATTLTRFREIFAALQPSNGYVVSLAEQEMPLTRTDSNLPLGRFLQKIAAQ